MSNLLTRYWFNTKGGYGIGVTAYSCFDAEQIIAAEPLVSEMEIIDIKENIDVRTLDQGHVIPNMGSPNVRGIWFPNFCR